jgi:hypothetical protein
MPPTEWFHPFAWWMFTNAWWQLEQQQFTAAVMLAQVSVEMAARSAFVALLYRRHGPLDDAMVREHGPPHYSFLDEETRRLWTDLTGGDSVTKPKEIWKPYAAHVEFRNQIAHGQRWGDGNGGRDALGSVLAAHGFMHRMSATLERIRAEDAANDAG